MLISMKNSWCHPHQHNLHDQAGRTTQRCFFLQAIMLFITTTIDILSKMLIIFIILAIFRQGRQRSVVGTILTTVLQLLGFEQNQLGSRALDMVSDHFHNYTMI